jgi:glutamate-1-semialdehyde 2,1-aminomutase
MARTTDDNPQASDPRVDLDRVAQLKRREDSAFVDARPRSLALLDRARGSMPLGVPMSWMDWLFDHPPIFVDSADGAYFTDVDGHRYLDMYMNITVSAAGHTHPAVVAAAVDRLQRGVQFGLPTEDAIVVSDTLAERWSLPKWQFALSSTQSVTDAIRLARIATGRERLLTFEGKYHGHVGELLAIEEGGRTVPEYVGIDVADIARTEVVDWNDLDGVERALGTGDIALLIAELALTNSGVVFPSSTFHAELRRLTRQTGTLLLVDETQTLPCAYGGLVHEWGLDPDFVVLGKSLGGGVPTSAYGMTNGIAALIERQGEPYEVAGSAVDEPAIGGTMFGNALSMAATRAALAEVWTPENHARTQQLAAQLVEGMRAAFDGASVDWDVYRLGNRAGFRFSPTPPTTNVEAGKRDIPAVRHLQRVFMANRGIWEFGWWCGPVVSAQATRDDIDFYLSVFSQFVRALLG